MITIPLTIITIGFAGFWDLKTNRIPNLITMPAVVLGLIINTYYFGLQGLGNSLLGTVVGTLLLIIPFAVGGIGAGDVKLLAAVGALNGLQFVFSSFLYSAVIGGIIASAILTVKGQLYYVLLNILVALQNVSFHIFKRREKQSFKPITVGISFPYGIAILLGTVAAYWLR